MTNVKCLPIYKTINTDDGSKFERLIEIYLNQGYGVIGCSLKGGKFKALLQMENESELVACMIDDTNNMCPYIHESGLCTCTHDDHCLFQQYESQLGLIKYMVKQYNDYMKDKDERVVYAYMTVNTIHGRVFSKEYEHLNGEEYPNIFDRWR